LKLTLESTTKIVHVNGVPARIWEGHTANGVPVHAYVTRVAVDQAEDAGELERELEEHRTPSPEIEAIPARLIL
jgi:hypothetical protein